MVRDIFKWIAERQAQGVIFHSEMADYYAFLNLQDFHTLHECQCYKENETFRKIKNFYINHYHQPLLTSVNYYSFNITPSEWQEKTSLDVDESTIQALVKNSLEIYLNWEVETCDYYKSYANQLFDEEEYASYNFVREIIDEVEKEKCHIMEIMTTLSVVDYNIYKVKGLRYKLYNK